MPTIRLTKRAIESLPFPTTGQVLYRDAEMRGLGVRVGKRAKTFFVESQVKRRTVRATVGRCDILSVEEARRRAMRLLTEMADGRNPNAERMAERTRELTLRQAFEAFLKARPLSPTTVPNYRSTFERYLGDWADKPIIEITRTKVMERHKQIGERTKTQANNVMRHLRAVYTFTMATHEGLPPNPVDILRQARAWYPTQRRRTLIQEHLIPQWFRAVLGADDQVRDFLLIALFTGMRRSEVARLRWENIDLTGKTLTVPRTKNGDPLELPLSKFLHELLLTRREYYPDAEWVFPGEGETGHLVETKRFYGRVEYVAGVNFTLHDLRRTYVTIAESLDIPAYALKRLLNHRATDVTSGYIVMGVERLRNHVERIAARILEIAKMPS